MPEGDSRRPLSQVRLPWRPAVGAWSGDHPGGGVVTCSAQGRDYRDLRSDSAIPPLTGDTDVMTARVADPTRPVDEPVDALIPRVGAPAVATTTGGTR
ncbi:MAG: hypothetical protein QOJ68_3173 [Blastococcus sp.]|nr:hypothetical protein [Blastococcus sp.]